MEDGISWIETCLHHPCPCPIALTQELRPGLVGTECLCSLHVLGHHVQPGWGRQQAEELWGDVVLHLPPAGTQRSGISVPNGPQSLQDMGSQPVPYMVGRWWPSLARCWRAASLATCWKCCSPGLVGGRTVNSPLR